MVDMLLKNTLNVSPAAALFSIQIYCQYTFLLQILLHFPHQSYICLFSQNIFEYFVKYITFLNTLSSTLHFCKNTLMHFLSDEQINNIQIATKPYVDVFLFSY